MVTRDGQIVFADGEALLDMGVVDAADPFGRSGIEFLTQEERRRMRD